MTVKEKVDPVQSIDYALTELAKIDLRTIKDLVGRTEIKQARAALQEARKTLAV